MTLNFRFILERMNFPWYKIVWNAAFPQKILLSTVLIAKGLDWINLEWVNKLNVWLLSRQRKETAIFKYALLEIEK